MSQIIRTERGWPGHFICASGCGFRRNTLLEYGDVRIVVSTVGLYKGHDGKIETIGHNRWYETMAFHAKKEGVYWEADVSKQISFESEWGIFKKPVTETDQEANDIHEAVVKEIAGRLASGDKFPITEY